MSSKIDESEAYKMLVAEDDIPPELMQYFLPVSVSEFPTVPAIVADIFVGSGTTLKAAANLLRRGIGIDLSLPYLSNLAQRRVGARLPM